MPRIVAAAIAIAVGIFGLYLFPLLKTMYDYLWDTAVAPLNPPAFVGATVGKPFILVLMVAFFIGIFYAIFHKDESQPPGERQ